MSVELRKRDADLLSDILADYLDNVDTENTVTKQCELLLALGSSNSTLDTRCRR